MAAGFSLGFSARKGHTHEIVCDPGAALCVTQVHNSSLHSTALATDLAKARSEGDTGASERALSKQLAMIVVLVRSLRAVEECRRDVLLLGVLPNLTGVWRALLDELGVTLHPTRALVEGSPATDKLHAWRLTQYHRLLVLDSDGTNAGEAVLHTFWYVGCSLVWICARALGTATARPQQGNG